MLKLSPLDSYFLTHQEDGVFGYKFFKCILKREYISTEESYPQKGSSLMLKIEVGAILTLFKPLVLKFKIFFMLIF